MTTAVSFQLWKECWPDIQGWRTDEVTRQPWPGYPHDRRVGCNWIGSGSSSLLLAANTSWSDTPSAAQGDVDSNKPRQELQVIDVPVGREKT